MTVYAYSYGPRDPIIVHLVANCEDFIDKLKQYHCRRMDYRSTENRSSWVFDLKDFKKLCEDLDVVQVETIEELEIIRKMLSNS